MPGLIYYDEIKRALFPKKTDQELIGMKLGTVERALIKLNLPYSYGVDGVFTTVDAWNEKILNRKPSVKGEEIDIDNLEFTR